MHLYRHQDLHPDAERGALGRKECQGSERANPGADPNRIWIPSEILNIDLELNPISAQPLWIFPHLTSSTGRLTYSTVCRRTGGPGRAPCSGLALTSAAPATVPVPVPPAAAPRPPLVSPSCVRWELAAAPLEAAGGGGPSSEDEAGGGTTGCLGFFVTRGKVGSSSTSITSQTRGFLSTRMFCVSTWSAV